MSILFGVIALLTTLPYDLPTTVVEFTSGKGEDQVGMTEEDIPVGPYRITATDSSIFILDQLNRRVLSFDTSGNLVKEIQTSFRPFDMAVGRSGRLYLLENRTQPAKIIVMLDDKVTDSLLIPYDTQTPLTAIEVGYKDNLLLYSGTDAFLLTQEQDTYSTIPTHSIPYRHRLLVTSTPTAAYRTWFVDAVDSSGSVAEFYLRPEATEEVSILADDASGRVYVASEHAIQDKSGTFYKRYLKVYEEGELRSTIPIDENYFSYDAGWRNVSVDARGNVYVFTSTPEGKAEILKWSTP